MRLPGIAIGLSWQGGGAVGPNGSPSALILTVISDTEIQLDCTSGSTNEDGFSWERSDDDGLNYVEIDTTLAGVVHYHDITYNGTNRYLYRVRAYKGSLYSDYSNVVNSDASYFITTWQTENAGSATKTIVVPTTGAGYNCWINWCDGSAEENAVGTPGNITHVYADTGIKKVKIRGTFPRIYFNNGGDKLKLLTIANWGDIVWSSMAFAFQGCANLTGTYTDIPNTASVISMLAMFGGCAAFNSAVGFNTANVNDMTSMFGGCSVFNQSLASFNTAKVIDMTSMFGGCSAFNQSLAGFDVSIVTNMSRLVYNCAVFNQSFASFNIIKVTTLDEFLAYSNALSTANYNATLIAWGALAVKDKVPFHAGTAKYTDGGAAAAARAHLVLAVASGGHEWAITDGGALAPFDNGKLVITFDDGENSQYLAYEDLITQGEKATFYIISSVIGTGAYLTWIQVQAMLAGGMDIQCHTYDHTLLTTLSQAQVYAKYDDLNTNFVANSIPAANHTAYPYGYSNADVQTWTATRRLTARATNPGNVLRNTKKMILPAYGADISTNYNALKALMDIALANKEAMLIYGHGIGGLQIPRAEFNGLIDYAQSIGMDIITISELYALME